MTFPCTVHRTAAIYKNVNSIPLNLPDAGFYSIDKAAKYITDNPDYLNYSLIVQYETGDVLETIKPHVIAKT